MRVITSIVFVLFIASLVLAYYLGRFVENSERAEFIQTLINYTPGCLT